MISSLSEKYIKQLEEIKKIVGKKYKEVTSRFHNFTFHDLEHVNQVTMNLGKLCKPLKLAERTRFCLLAASYCHDIGMSNSKASRISYWLNRSEARKEHAKFSATAVLDETLFDAETIGDSVPRWAIARICEGHGRWDLENEDFNNIEDINIRLCAVLLSLADALDIRSERRNPLELDNIDQLMNHPFLKEDVSQLSEIKLKPELIDIPKVHWLRHYYINSPPISSDPA